MIKASSMAYAIFIFVIIGICCYTIIMVGSTSSYLHNLYYLQRELIYTMEDSQNYFLSNMDNEHVMSGSGDILQNGMQSTASISPWGCFKLLKMATSFKKDTVFRNVLVGELRGDNRPALYLSGMEDKLHITGDVVINGDVFTPQSRIEAAYLDRKSYTQLKVSGRVHPSERFLPKIENTESDWGNTTEVILDTIARGVPLFNDFKSKTLKVLTTKSDVSDINLQGNIVLKSNDSLVIHSNCRMNDIIIDAPKVIFKEGFKGSLQVFAKTKIVLEKGVYLGYPSILYCGGEDEKVSIYLDEGTRLEGGIILKSEKYVGEAKRLVTLNKNSLVIGDIYCNGSIDLKGRVEGSVYTDNFYLKTVAGNYTNYIKEGKIYSNNIPGFFVGPLSFKENTSNHNSYAVVKQL